MKRVLTLLAAGICCLALHAAKWQTVTNTSHVYDLMVQDEDVYISTWGGVLQLGLTPSAIDNHYALEQKKIWTTADGLASNDVRNIEYISASQSLWLGSAFDGISIVSPLGIQQLNTELGLPSNRVTGIVEHGSNILVATANGLASYYYLEGVNFPLLLHLYSAENTNGGLLDNQIGDMALAANNYLYLSSTAGVNFVHVDSLDVDSAWHRFQGTPFPTGYENKLALSEQKLLIASATAVYVHASDPWSDGWQVISSGQGLLAEVISSVCMDYWNTVWVSYGQWDEDFQVYSSSSDTLLTSIDANGNVRHWSAGESGLGSKSVSRIVPSQSGRIVYLCTWGDGIYTCQDVWADNTGKRQLDMWVHFEPNSIGFPKIRQIATDANHAAWFSSGNFNHLPLKKSALGTSRYLDGEWQTFTTGNSPIHTDNVLTVAVDSHNRKWFGTYDVTTGSPENWDNGLTIYDEETGVWRILDNDGIRIWDSESSAWGDVVPGSPTLLGNTATHISQDLHGNMLVACYDDGFSVLNAVDSLVATFTIPNSVYQRSTFSYHNGRQYFIGTENDRGLVIWNDDSIPVTGGEHWIVPPPSDLNNCEVYGVVTLESPYEGTQHWIAASTGLFMWDEAFWYKWDTTVKRFIYNTSTNLWDNDLLYYVDEERLYGSVRTTPTAIFLDPFNRIWIGSLEHGISMYDPQTERFTNYYQDNSPLLSNYITALGYQPTEGLLLIGTPDGLNTLSIGRTIKPETVLETLKIYPNPFRPDGKNTLIISNFPTEVMPRGTNQCRIYDAAGALVMILEENEFSRFEWNGQNAKGKKCASGVYYVVVNDAKGQRRSGKIALLR